MSGYAEYDEIEIDKFNFVDELVSGLAFNGLIVPTAVFIFIISKLFSRIFKSMINFIKQRRYRHYREGHSVV